MTQHYLILDYLKRFHSITPYEAFKDLGITKLATRVSELRRMGFNIPDEWVDDYNRFGDAVRFKRYFLKRRKDWTEDDLLTMNKSKFTSMFDVTNEEWEQLHKEFQEM